MGHHKTKKILLLLFLPLMALLYNCVPMATDLRRIGFNEIQKGFDSLEKTPNLYEIIKLDNVTVHIVGDRKFFKWDKAAAYGSPVAGYATTKNEIWVFGKIVKGKIVINQAILGHEFNHLLNFKNPRIANPDKLDDLGA
ncbi:MAG: hypothetical protein JRK26_18095 [Deltaproteobacteria bacterium]|nr:hypothetical protein [Deltaproteobacteria bacterium]